MLSQNDLFQAEGGFGTVGLQVALGMGGVAAACAFNPRLVNYFKNGQLRFTEWATLGLPAAFGYMVGHKAGALAMGDN